MTDFTFTQEQLAKLTVQGHREIAELARDWATTDGYKEGFTMGTRPWWNRYREYRYLLIQEVAEQ